MAEQWKPIASYEGMYEVSDQGRVRSLDRVIEQDGYSRLYPGRVLKQTVNRQTGYAGVALSREGKAKTRLVHHLVADAFLGPRPEGLQANHRNGRKLDNAATNLEWQTASENVKHAYATGLAKGHGCGRKLSEPDVQLIKFWRGLMPNQEMAGYFGVSRQNIDMIMRGERWAGIEMPALLDLQPDATLL